MDVDVLVPAIEIGLIYALVALSFNAVFVTTGVLNFAQGELVVLGALVAYTARVQLGLPYPLVLVAVVVVMVPAGLLMERIVMVPVRLSGSPYAWVIATIAAVIVISNLLALAYGREIRVLPAVTTGAPFGIAGRPIGWQVVLVLLTAVSVLLAYKLFLDRTRFGKAIRAVSYDPTVAEMMGIDSRRIIALSFVASALIAGIAGLLVAPTFFVSSQTGLLFTLKGLVAVVIGGLGSAGGAVVGGLIVGLLDTVVRNYAPAGFGNLTVFTVLALVLLTRPAGLFGRPVETL